MYDAIAPGLVYHAPVHTQLAHRGRTAQQPTQRGSIADPVVGEPAAFQLSRHPADPALAGEREQVAETIGVCVRGHVPVLYQICN
jgi:hypothetical protein